MAKKKSSKVEVELRRRIAELEKALDDATGRLKRARKDADKARTDAEKAIRKASKSAQRKIAETVDAARDELVRLRTSAVKKASGGSEQPVEVSSPPSEAVANARSTATPEPTLRKVAARDVPKERTPVKKSTATTKKAAAKKTTAKKSTAKKSAAKKSAAKKTTAKKTPAKKSTATEPRSSTAPSATSAAAPAGSYASMTVVDLRKAARQKGVKGYSSLSKTQLVARLEG
ncbi:hypothetical protein [Mumia sp. DW29H23]|uniref:hypothetical protein n=1 Tax=Mumia sp. DW29H23 TaxID=3421241 RepID=UPI003D688E17